jgi:hypothetical protein
MIEAVFTLGCPRKGFLGSSDKLPDRAALTAANSFYASLGHHLRNSRTC